MAAVPPSTAPQPITVLVAPAASVKQSRSQHNTRAETSRAVDGNQKGDGGEGVRKRTRRGRRERGRYIDIIV